MYFVASKIGWFFLQPSMVLICTTVLGSILLLTRFQRTARYLAIVGGLAFGLCALTPIGVVIMLPLENYFPVPDLNTIEDPTGIIVLGGALKTDLTVARASNHSGAPVTITGPIMLKSSGSRLTESLALARRFPKARLIFTGGSEKLIGKVIPESDVAKEFYHRLGLIMNRLVIERKSRNTLENARFTKELVGPRNDQTWILVTSAFHMPRAVAVFRKSGFKIIPYPVDYHTSDSVSDYRKYSLSPIDALKLLDRATKEWIGLTVYWLTSRTTSILPTQES